MLPPTTEISSSVQTFFGFFFSLAWSFPALGSFGAAVPAAAGAGCGAAGAGGWDCGAGLPAPESEPDCEDCARQLREANEARTLARISERRMKPPAVSPAKIGRCKKYTGGEITDQRLQRQACPSRHRPVPFESPRALLWAGRCTGSSNKRCARERKNLRRVCARRNRIAKNLRAKVRARLRSAPA